MKVFNAILCIILFLSCASRKVEKHAEKITIAKTDQLQNTGFIKNDIVIDINTNTDIISVNDQFIIKPVDNSKPMSIGDKVFINAIITAKKSQIQKREEIKEHRVDNSEIISQINQQSTIKTSHTTKSKETKRGSNYWYWLLLILIIVLGYREYKKISK